MEFTGGLLFI